MNEMVMNGFVDEIGKEAKVDKDIRDYASKGAKGPVIGYLAGSALGAIPLYKGVKAGGIGKTLLGGLGYLGSVAGGTALGGAYKKRQQRKHLRSLDTKSRTRLIGKLRRRSKEMPAFNKAYNEAFAKTKGLNRAKRHKQAVSMLSPKHQQIANQIM